MSIDARTIELIGEDSLGFLKSAKVVVFGLGGVGGTAAESLARSSIGELILVDKDVVDPSNLNRQILFTSNDIGKPKAEVAKIRLSSINPNIGIKAIDANVDSSFFESFAESSISYIVDAIDDSKGKLAIAGFAMANKIPLISSMGMGNRLDPSKVKLVKLNQTEGDPFARNIRRLFKEKGIDISKIDCVISSEAPLVRNPKPSSMMMVPSSAGLLIAYKVISSLLNKGKSV